MSKVVALFLAVLSVLAFVSTAGAHVTTSDLERGKTKVFMSGMNRCTATAAHESGWVCQGIVDPVFVANWPRGVHSLKMQVKYKVARDVAIVTCTITSRVEHGKIRGTTDTCKGKLS